MWSSSYTVTDRATVSGTLICNSSSESGVGRADEPESLVGLFALQLTVLVFIAALGTFANALVFAVFYRRPTLRTISNRSVSHQLFNTYRDLSIPE